LAHPLLSTRSRTGKWNNDLDMTCSGWTNIVITTPRSVSQINFNVDILGVDWIHVAHYRVQWRASTNTITNLWFP
jgi:hypothetical protein